MKRVRSPSIDHSTHKRPVKVRRRKSWNTPPGSIERVQEGQTKAQPLPSLFSPNTGNRNPVYLEHQATTGLPLIDANTQQQQSVEIYDWIPSPVDIDKIDEIDDMSRRPASKRSRSRSVSTDRGRTRSVSSDSENSSTRDIRSSAYKAPNYVIILETKGCFMRQSSAGPIPEDIALCEQLLHQPIETPRGTLFDDEYIEEFHNTLRNRSEARLLVDLHPLLMPSAENQYIQGKPWLQNVIDGYNDPWLKTEPIYGPKPQPDHARGLKWSIFSEDQRRKLRVQPDEKSLYTAREDMYFPYLTAEIKCGNQALELADRQNMHSMCIALRAVVALSRLASCPEQIHRRILGFSVSHELEGLRIYGYYPEIDGENTLYFRWPVAQLSIWTKEDKWTCYRFIENLDREFLPIHTNRLMRLLANVPDLEECSLSANIETESQVSQTGLQDRSGLPRTTSSQGRGLQPELRMMVQTLQQQLAEQREREDKREAEQREREAEQKAREEKQQAEQRDREEKLLAQIEQQRKEQTTLQEKQREREEKLLAQLEQQRKEQTTLQEKLLTLLR